MKLRHVVLHLGKSHLEALVDDHAGQPHLVDYRWVTKMPTDVLDAAWWIAVQAEVEETRTREVEERTGRRLV